MWAVVMSVWVMWLCYVVGSVAIGICMEGRINIYGDINVYCSII